MLQSQQAAEEERKKGRKERRAKGGNDDDGAGVPPSHLPSSRTFLYSLQHYPVKVTVLFIFKPKRRKGEREGGRVLR
jgi:hypothetical protein